MKNTALVIIDLQNDFCPGGALPVPEGDKIICNINKIIKNFYKVIATQDWHPKNHISFASTHSKNIGDIVEINGMRQILWPDHCVAATEGAQLHKELDHTEIDLIIRKGTNPSVDSYSAFLENDKITETGLNYYLDGLKIKDVYICGLALDYCVYYSAVDAKKFGFDTYVILNATKGVDIPKGNIERALSHMRSLNIKLINYEDI
ncbi:MAG: bifunctional nicotinamidase/pyrazinamidase [Endomicrobia bacterium]|nr:bifunctional nicotinamidase/pyrazinamidase [Endomicrobiia bacterium]